MSLFGNLKTTDDMEATEDRLGGGFSPLESNIYTGKIKLAYAGQSAKGARNVTLIMTGGDFGDREYRETIYITNVKGENFYLKDGKKYQLPGFIVLNHLAQCTVGKELSELIGEDKQVNIYDAEQKKEVPKAVPVLVELLGQEVSLAILKTVENKTEKQGDKYVAIADTREVNNIEKVFHTASKMTVNEAQARQKPGGDSVTAEFWDKWVEKNKGKTRDKVDKDAAAASGNSGRPGGAAPQSGNSGGQPPRTSLFGGN